MIEYKYKDFKYSLTNFPLISQMVEKNDYTNSKVFIEKDSDGPVSIAICDMDKKDKSCFISAFEVRKDARDSYVGTELISELKALNNFIYIQPTDNSKEFYMKNGFEMENTDMMVWSDL